MFFPLVIALAGPQPPSAMPQKQLYNETYRPQFHFSPRQNWLNDPNGLVYFKGTWHLFYQYAPDLRGNALKYWGYATSPDLVHWKEHGLAVAPDDLGAVWSGGGAVDWTNSTGFGNNGKPPLVAMYTAGSGSFTQRLVYSADDGKTWNKYPDPVLPHIVGENRDPRPVWYKPSKSWVVAVYLDGDEFAFFGSKDMKAWSELSRLRLPGSGECPELFELPVEGGKGETKWVFFAADFHYLIGSFDGKVFKPEEGPFKPEYGNSFYASQTWSDAPNDRRVQIAWMPRGEPMPGMNFTGQMSFPCDMTLRKTPAGLRLFRNPVHEISKLHKQGHSWHGMTVASETPLPELGGDLYDVEVSIDPGTSSECGLIVRGEKIAYSATDRKVRCLGCEMPVEPVNGLIELRVLVDRVTIEVFGADGAASMASYFLPAAEARGMAAFATGGTAKFVKIQGFELRSAW